MHVKVSDIASVEQQLAHVRQELQDLEKELNREVTRMNPRIFGPTRVDWNASQELRFRQQLIKVRNLERVLSNLRKDAKDDAASSR